MPLVGSLATLQQAVDVRVAETLAVVPDIQVQPVVGQGRGDRDPRAAMFVGVFQQVAEQFEQVALVGANLQIGWDPKAALHRTVAMHLVQAGTQAPQDGESRIGRVTLLAPATAAPDAGS